MTIFPIIICVTKNQLNKLNHTGNWSVGGRLLRKFSFVKIVLGFFQLNYFPYSLLWHEGSNATQLRKNENTAPWWLKRNGAVLQHDSNTRSKSLLQRCVWYRKIGVGLHFKPIHKLTDHRTADYRRYSRHCERDMGFCASLYVCACVRHNPFYICIGCWFSCGNTWLMMFAVWRDGESNQLWIITLLGRSCSTDIQYELKSGHLSTMCIYNDACQILLCTEGTWGEMRLKSRVCCKLRSGFRE